MPKLEETPTENHDRPERDRRVVDDAENLTRCFAREVWRKRKRGEHLSPSGVPWVDIFEAKVGISLDEYAESENR